MTDFRRQWNEACKAAGLASIGRDTAAKILAIVYELGGEMESFTHNEKLKADLEYIQEVYGFQGGMTPDPFVSQNVRCFCNEFEDYGTTPEWAKKLMKEMYDIEI